MQRRKGHDFERAVANAYRNRWPHLTVRRSQQGDKAFEPDVVVEGVPLWTECCIGAKPDPIKKLAQAERDVGRFTEPMLPVVVWRKSGTRATYATMRLGTLMLTQGWVFGDHLDEDGELVVTVDYDEWLSMVDLSETWVKEAT